MLGLIARGGEVAHALEAALEGLFEAARTFGNDIPGIATDPVSPKGGIFVVVAAVVGIYVYNKKRSAGGG